MKNPSIPDFYPIGHKGDRAIVDLQIELPQSGKFTIRAIMVGPSGDMVEICESNDDDTMIEHLVTNYGIDINTAKNAVRFRRNYGLRLIAAEQHNDEQKKLFGGLAHQYEAGKTIYSIICHAKYRVAHPNKPDQVTQEYYEVMAQDLTEPDPDKALIDSTSCDTLYECIVWIRNQIERDLITEIANGTITI